MLLRPEFGKIPTPFYFYDKSLLERTLDVISDEVGMLTHMHVHYAVKANANHEVMRMIASRGFGADCVSGWEVQAALDAGFEAQKIVFAGVAKTDWEIRMALNVGIGAFNVESIPELEVISQIACELGVEARVALRINPNVGANTHVNITTGLSDNKFGIDMVNMMEAIKCTRSLPSIRLTGLHFHIGSQITDMDDFAALCHRINSLQDELEAADKRAYADLLHINVGGGLGIDYINPDEHPIPDFTSYFATFHKNLHLRNNQHLHFELGRSVVGQMGSLITSVIYVKENEMKRFAIVDAGFTHLIRPALYGAYHRVDNLTSPNAKPLQYDVVGPICESTDTFVRDYNMPSCKRGDLLALRSAGAYGEVMASNYNCRPLPKGYLM